MRILIGTLLSFVVWGRALGQEKEIFPDPITIHGKGNIKQIQWIDLRDDSVKVKTMIIQDGRITKEAFHNYQPAFGNFPIDGVFSYTYKSTDDPVERLYYNSKEDTLKVTYTFKKHTIRKMKTWELERRSKFRQGAPEYGDGKPGGCIPAEEDIIRYRKWVNRGIFKYKRSDERLTAIKTRYDYAGSAKSIVFTYRNNLLVNKKQLGRRNEIQWEENYEYKDNIVIMTKRYFVTYWGKIPPTEKWTHEFDSDKREITVMKELDGQSDKEIVSKSYDDNGNLRRLTKTINGTDIRIDYLVMYK